MKFYIYLFIVSAMLLSCGGEAETDVDPEKENTTELADSIDTHIEDELDVTEPEYTYVISAKIGIYGEQALMVIKTYAEDDRGICQAEGYYFYVKHHKNLDLSGEFDPVENRFVLTEFYKGKASGYMDFIPDNAADSFWAPASDSENEQDMRAQILMSDDPYELSLALNNGKYTNPHDIEMYMGEEEGWEFESVVDELCVTNVNDEYLVFDIRVTGRNAHSGSANGVALIQGNEAIWSAPDDEDGCTLYFDLSDNGQISVREENCDYYHGFNARFDGVFLLAK